jgi:hypothetical protein
VDIQGVVTSKVEMFPSVELRIYDGTGAITVHFRESVFDAMHTEDSVIHREALVCHLRALLSANTCIPTSLKDTAGVGRITTITQAVAAWLGYLSRFSSGAAARWVAQAVANDILSDNDRFLPLLVIYAEYAARPQSEHELIFPRALCAHANCIIYCRQRRSLICCALENMCACMDRGNGTFGVQMSFRTSLPSKCAQWKTTMR